MGRTGSTGSPWNGNPQLRLNRAAHTQRSLALSASRSLRGRQFLGGGSICDAEIRPPVRGSNLQSI